MSAKHTAGPWHIRAERYRFIHVTATGGGIAHLDTIDGEGMANARLIAAAPELLEACRTFAEWLRREEEGFPDAAERRKTPEGEAEWHEWWVENLRLCSLAQTQALAAIAKATGAQP